MERPAIGKADILKQNWTNGMGMHSIGETWPHDGMD